MLIEKNNYWRAGRRLYLLLWSGTFLITMIMVNLKYNKPKSINLFKNKAFDPSASTGYAINELLLSTGQLEIAEKKSFISLYLKPDEGVYKVIVEQSVNENVYKAIFQRKINSLQQKKKNYDFSIKPIPK